MHQHLSIFDTDMVHFVIWLHFMTTAKVHWFVLVVTKVLKFKIKFWKELPAIFVFRTHFITFQDLVSNFPILLGFSKRFLNFLLKFQIFQGSCTQILCGRWSQLGNCQAISKQLSMIAYPEVWTVNFVLLVLVGFVQLIFLQCESLIPVLRRFLLLLLCWRLMVARLRAPDAPCYARGMRGLPTRGASWLGSLCPMILSVLVGIVVQSLLWELLMWVVVWR